MPYGAAVAISPYITRIRERIGTDLLLVPTVAVLPIDADGRLANHTAGLLAEEVGEAVVLVGIVVAIFVKEGLGLDILPASSRFSTPGGGQFTLCSRENRAQCVVDGDTIHYAGLKIRLEDRECPLSAGSRWYSRRAGRASPASCQQAQNRHQSSDKTCTATG